MRTLQAILPLCAGPVAKHEGLHGGTLTMQEKLVSPESAMLSAMPFRLFRLARILAVGRRGSAQAPVLVNGLLFGLAIFAGCSKQAAPPAVPPDVKVAAVEQRDV